MVQRTLIQDSVGKKKAASGRESSRVERVVRWDSWPRQHCALRFEIFLCDVDLMREIGPRQLMANAGEK